mmetsp:Transcript_74408/g.198465  ORF Transcript_74408/g.198465 Transcript_74408/m.198465 type:complete len:202 (+) Transcript_74408:205-810(+)
MGRTEPDRHKHPRAVPFTLCTSKLVPSWEGPVPAKKSARAWYTALDLPGSFLKGPWLWRCRVPASSSPAQSARGFTHQKSILPESMTAYATACIPQTVFGHDPATTNAKVPDSPVSVSVTRGPLPAAMSLRSGRSQANAEGAFGLPPLRNPEELGRGGAVIAGHTAGAPTETSRYPVSISSWPGSLPNKPSSPAAGLGPGD